MNPTTSTRLYRVSVSCWPKTPSAREALYPGQPDCHPALHWLQDALPAVDSRRLRQRIAAFRRLECHRPAWETRTEEARMLLARRGDTLLRDLAFGIEPVDQVTSVLRSVTTRD